VALENIDSKEMNSKKYKAGQSWSEKSLPILQNREHQVKS